MHARGRPAWYWLYFLLALLDVITVLVSLGLNHRLMGIYAESVAVNQQWAERLSRYADLAVAAGEVNAHGNDVFDSRDVSRESERLNKALAELVPLERVRGYAGEGGPADIADVWMRLAEFGLPGLMIAEDHGGLGLGMLEAALASGALGRVAAAAPSISTP